MSNRGCEGPEQMVNFQSSGDRIIDCSQDTKASGGLGSIAMQLSDSKMHVLLGGGMSFFNQPVKAGGDNVLALAKEKGFKVITSLAQAAEITSVELQSGEKLMGLFADVHLPVKLQGTDGRKAEKVEFSFLNFFHKYLGEVTLPATMKCEANPEFAKQNTPALKDLTQLALKQLKNNKGFFLMVESASIDKQSHKRNPCGSIGEAQQLFETVQVALDFAKDNKDTLILITADHGQAAQIVPNGSLFDVYGVPIGTPGAVARIETPEGGIMAVNYATNEFGYEEHTGVNVPLFANRQVQNKQGQDLILPMVQQPDIFEISKAYLGL